MSGTTAKRFWKAASVGEVDGGFTVLLDGRPVRTPAKAAFVLPSRALAEACAAEWDAQKDIVKPATMPLTRTANSAIDKVAAQHAEVADMLADYGDSDLLCYRADGPETLEQRQAEGWDPLLDWASETLGARLVPVTGVIHAPQSPDALQRLRDQTHAFSPFALAAFHDLVAISGSLVLGFATVHGHLPPDSLWSLSRIDETWQEDQWGVDEEAAAHSELKRLAFLDAARFFRLLDRDE